MPIPNAGEAAPDFTAETDAGERLTLSSLRGSWIILFFYPKDDTPG
jgi:peroxiredoxin Q/BCP